MFSTHDRPDRNDTLFCINSNCKLFSFQQLFKHERRCDDIEMTQWHLIQFKPNSHRLAERNLQRQDFETFLPFHEVTRRKTHRFITDLIPLIPGYMFVGINMNSAPWRGSKLTALWVFLGSLALMAPPSLCHYS